MKYPRDRVNFHTITGRGTWLTRHQDLTRYKATAKAVWYCTGIEKLINWRNYNIQKHTHAYMELWYFIRWLLKINGELIAARTIVHADRKKEELEPCLTDDHLWSSLPSLLFSHKCLFLWITILSTQLPNLQTWKLSLPPFIPQTPLCKSDT